jgi:hypothetical protein
MIRSLEVLLTKNRAARTAKSTLQWLCEHEQNFSISPAPTEAVPWHVKPLAELMFLLTALKRHGLATPAVERLSEGALADASVFDWHELAAYDPSAATGMTIVADFFQSFGRPVPFDQSYFSLMNGIDYFDGIDRLPYREMDLVYNLGRIVAPEYERTLSSWFRSTAFGRQQHVVRYSIDDLYSITHAVFYLTDLGLRDVELVLDRDTAERLRSELATLTAAMLRADNRDVLGELLLCWLFCGVENNPLNRTIFNHALQQMLASVTDAGAVAPTNEIFRQSVSGQASFNKLYHTTLVGAFLFALLSGTHSYAVN